MIDIQASGGSGGSSAPIKTEARISKIMLWPSRKINLGNYSTVDKNAGIEMVFDEPVYIESQAVKDAFERARTVIRNEFKEQYKPYTVKKLQREK